MGLETWLGDRSQRPCKTWEKVGLYSSVMGSYVWVCRVVIVSDLHF